MDAKEINVSLYKNTHNLEDRTSLELIEFGDENDWLEKRKRTIGGSEIGIILGLNDYTSKLQLYKRKLPGFHEQSDSIYTRKGKALENYILENYAYRYCSGLGYSVTKPDVMFVDNKTPWLSANLDGLAIPSSGFSHSESERNFIVEIKWVSEWGAVKWDGEDYCGIPASYYAQVQQYMYVMNAHKAVVFALFDETWECKTYEIPRDENFIRRLVNESKEFYDKHMVAKVAPDLDMRFDTAEATEAIDLFNCVPEKNPTKKSPEFDLLLGKYKSLKNSEKDIERECKDTLSELLKMHLEGYVPDKSPFKFTASVRHRTGIDTAKLKEKYPDIAKELTKESSYTFTSIK